MACEEVPLIEENLVKENDKSSENDFLQMSKFYYATLETIFAT